ncbi:hypothetical protein HR17_09090 [Porphyromonas gulae]|uniref:hypothetical protein n=1 Tax=Porphyromonas gulae TaxID=111105 RepID=UPI00052CF1A7|nr:hypothetical protein [Porphyromonas gulae]KGN72032.1 hypothetical protein HR17_09090 [Porphyromonas gulae]KGO05228.1 hypothetical protein HR16_01055 [Porphyromonas gulae]
MWIRQYPSSGNIALVHKGIIENYSTLKAKLQAQGDSIPQQYDCKGLDVDQPRNLAKSVMVE